jgi:hypothetical protein
MAMIFVKAIDKPLKNVINGNYFSDNIEMSVWLVNFQQTQAIAGVVKSSTVKTNMQPTYYKSR